MHPRTTSTPCRPTRRATGWPPAWTCRAGSTGGGRTPVTTGRAAVLAVAAREGAHLDDDELDGRPGAAPADRRAGRASAGTTPPTRRASRPASTAPTRERRRELGRATVPTRSASTGCSSSARPGATATRSWPSSSGGSATTTRPSVPRPSTSSPRSRCCASEQVLSLMATPEHPRPRHQPAAGRRSGCASPWSRTSGADRRRGGDRRRRPACPRSGPEPAPGDYRLRFDTGAYFAQTGATALLPRGRGHLHGRGRRAPPRPAAAQPVRLLDLPWLLTSSCPRPPRGRRRRARRAVAVGRRATG